MVTAAAVLALVLAVPAGIASATSSQAKTVKVSTDKVTGIGTVLTTPSGLTLYRFTEDIPGTSSCTGTCARSGRRSSRPKGAHVSGPKGVKGLAVMNVGNGRWQVAYHKIPLYRFEGDKKKGQANGQRRGQSLVRRDEERHPGIQRGTADRIDDTDDADTDDADTDDADTDDDRHPQYIDIDVTGADTVDAGSGSTGHDAADLAAADDTADLATHHHATPVSRRRRVWLPGPGRPCWSQWR